MFAPKTDTHININPHIPTDPRTHTDPHTNTATPPPPSTGIKIDKDFQNKMIAECAQEIFDLKLYKTKKDTPQEQKKQVEDELKKLKEVMKKYEKNVYEKYIQKIAVSTLDRKNEKQDLINTSIKYPFAGDASFLTDYHRLLRGYEEEANFNPQKLPYEVRMPKDMDIRKPEVPYKGEKLNYIDTQANSKFYFPQDYQPHYDKKNFYTNKPSSDISNQQHLFVSTHEGVFDPYSSHAMGFGNQIGMQGFRSQAGLAVSQQNVQFPTAPEDDTKLRNTINALGGITRTLPNMERSLYDNEIRNIEKNYRYHNQLDNTSNKRLNTLLQNPMTQVYSPHFDAPNARAASPQRGDIPNLQKPGLYFSPEKNQTGSLSRLSQLPPQMPPQMTGNFIPEPVPFMLPTRDGLAERNLNGAYRPTFSSSKSLREEKLDFLKPQYNL